MHRFIDRDQELTSLTNRFDRSSGELIIIYGHRRVGKSELIDQFIGLNAGENIQVWDMNDLTSLCFPSGILKKGWIHLG